MLPPCYRKSAISLPCHKHFRFNKTRISRGDAILFASGKSLTHDSRFFREIYKSPTFLVPTFVRSTIHAHASSALLVTIFTNAFEGVCLLAIEPLFQSLIHRREARWDVCFIGLQEGGRVEGGGKLELLCFNFSCDKKDACFAYAGKFSGWPKMNVQNTSSSPCFTICFCQKSFFYVWTKIEIYLV